MRTDLLLLVVVGTVVGSGAGFGLFWGLHRRFPKGWKAKSIIPMLACGITLTVVSLFSNTALRHAEAPTSRLKVTTKDAEVVPVEQESVEDKTKRERERAERENAERKQKFQELEPKVTP